MSSGTPVWFVTGANSGFGKFISEEALRRGHRVIATGRSLPKLEPLKAAGAAVLQFDVTSTEDVFESKIKEAHAIYGRFDYVINAAGFIQDGANEEFSEKEIFNFYNTNVFGPMKVTKAVTPYLREQRSGVITNFGSVGSWYGGAVFGLYCSTKWAVSGFSLSMTEELKDFGITVTVIEPGYFRTDFLSPNNRTPTASNLAEVYKGTQVDKNRQMLDMYNGHQPGNPEKAGPVIVDILTKTGVAEGREIPPRLLLGSDCMTSVQEEMEKTKKMIGDWKDVITSTDFPQ